MCDKVITEVGLELLFQSDAECEAIDIKMILINYFIVLLEKFLQFDWLRAVVFQLNLKYLHVKITTLLQVEV